MEASNKTSLLFDTPAIEKCTETYPGGLLVTCYPPNNGLFMYALYLGGIKAPACTPVYKTSEGNYFLGLSLDEEESIGFSDLKFSPKFDDDNEFIGLTTKSVEVKFDLTLLSNDESVMSAGIQTTVPVMTAGVVNARILHNMNGLEFEGHTIPNGNIVFNNYSEFIFSGSFDYLKQSRESIELGYNDEQVDISDSRGIKAKKGDGDAVVLSKSREEISIGENSRTGKHCFIIYTPKSNAYRDYGGQWYKGPDYYTFIEIGGKERQTKPMYLDYGPVEDN